MSIPDNYPDVFEWAVECERRAEKAEAMVKELKAIYHEIVVGWDKENDDLITQAFSRYDSMRT